MIVLLSAMMGPPRIEKFEINLDLDGILTIIHGLEKHASKLVEI